MKIQNNRIVLDLKKVQWGKFYYKNQYGDTRNLRPKSDEFSVNGVVYKINEPAYPAWDKVSLYDKAKERSMVDVWVPHAYFQLTANHSLTYTGDKAKALWKEWSRIIFGD